MSLPYRLTIGSCLQGTILLNEFHRLADILLETAGEVQVKLEFRRAKRRKTLVVGRCTANVLMTCQNCLCPMEYSLEATVRHIIVQSEEDILALGDDQDCIVHESEVIAVTAILEDEMLLNLPMAARHSDEEVQAGRCKLDADHQNDETPVGPQTHNPFASLADLQKKV